MKEIFDGYRENIRLYTEKFKGLSGVYLIEFDEGCKFGKAEDLAKRIENYLKPWNGKIKNIRCWEHNSKIDNFEDCSYHELEQEVLNSIEKKGKIGEFIYGLEYDEILPLIENVIKWFPVSPAYCAKCCKYLKITKDSCRCTTPTVKRFGLSLLNAQERVEDEISGWGVNVKYLMGLEKDMKKFDLNLLYEAVVIGRYYLKKDPTGKCTRDSVEIFLKKLGGIMFNLKQKKSDPEYEEFKKLIEYVDSKFGTRKNWKRTVLIKEMMALRSAGTTIKYLYKFFTTVPPEVQNLEDLLEYLRNPNSHKIGLLP